MHTSDSKIIALSLHDEVRERLRARILDRELQPGERIDELALVKDFGISRTPLREALKVLQAEGLVTLVPRRGCFVTELSEADLDDIYATVALIESATARKVAQVATAVHISRLTHLQTRLEAAARAGDHDAYRQVNRETHQLLQDISSNRWQKDILENLRRVLHLARYITIWLPERLQESVGEHRRLLEAIVARDTVGAAGIMHMHVMNQREALRRLHDASVASGAQA